MLNEKIIKIKNRLYAEKIEKTGKNTFQNFNFFELKDFLPRLIQFMNEEEINDQFTIENNEAILILNYKEEKNTYKIPFVMFDTPLNKAGKESMQPIQYLGALNTYYKRYLYLNAFSIAENDVIDAMEQTESKTKNSSKGSDQNKRKDYNDMTVKEKIDTCTKFINANRNEHEEIIENMTNGKTLGEMAVKELEAIVETIKITKKKGA
jgi:hypothetical protein